MKQITDKISLFFIYGVPIIGVLSMLKLIPSDTAVFIMFLFSISTIITFLIRSILTHSVIRIRERKGRYQTITQVIYALGKGEIVLFAKQNNYGCLFIDEAKLIVSTVGDGSNFSKEVDINENGSLEIFLTDFKESTNINYYRNKSLFEISKKSKMEE